jgi:hypothetical protein
MSEFDLCVVHLVWGPLGRLHLERFVESYTSRDAGHPHRLVVILNNLDDELRADVAVLLRDLRHEKFTTTEPAFDLEAYRLAVARFPADGYLFLNSYSRLLTDGWARCYASSLQRPDVGVVGAGGSFRSMRAYNPWVLRGSTLPPHKRALNQWSVAVRAFEARLRFPPSPTPFVRSNGFAIRAAMIERLGWPVCRSKWDTWKLESGRDGLTARSRRAGLRTVVADAYGRVFDPVEWPLSQTYWSGEQAGLLVADNRSDEYGGAEASERARLWALNWAVVAPGLPAGA